MHSVIIHTIHAFAICILNIPGQWIIKHITAGENLKTHFGAEYKRIGFMHCLTWTFRKVLDSRSHIISHLIYWQISHHVRFVYCYKYSMHILQCPFFRTFGLKVNAWKRLGQTSKYYVLSVSKVYVPFRQEPASSFFPHNWILLVRKFGKSAICNAKNGNISLILFCYILHFRESYWNIE